MLHEKERHFQPHLVTLDALVPRDNFYRQVEAKLDLSFVRELVREYYAQNMGRPSIDPVTFFKLHLIMCFEGKSIGIRRRRLRLISDTIAK